MKRQLTIFALFLTAVFSFIFLSGCVPMNTIPENFTEGVAYNSKYPDHILDIYDGATVYESGTRFGGILLLMGTKDSMEDVQKYYRNFLEENSVRPLKFEESSNYFYAHFKLKGYEFEVEIEPAEGEVESSVFNNVIIVSAAEAEDVMQAEVTAGSITSEAAANTPQPGPTQKTQPGQDESPLQNMQTGSWFMISYLAADDTPAYFDLTLYIKDSTNGTFHKLAYQYDVKEDIDFTYELENGVLTLNLKNGTQLVFDAYEYFNTIRLVSQDDGSRANFLNWENTTGIYPADSYMTAYGDWIYYNNTTGSIETMAIWGNDGGFLYNVFGGSADNEASWEYTGNTLSFPFNPDYSGYTLALEQRGNVLIASDNQGVQKIFNRSSENVMAGAYELLDSNEPDLEMWVMVLRQDSYSFHSLTADGSSFDQDNVAWFINYADGTFNVMLNGDQHIYYYHFSETGFNLYEPVEGFYYIFTELD